MMMHQSDISMPAPHSPIVNMGEGSERGPYFEGYLQKSDGVTSRRVFCILSQTSLRCFADEVSAKSSTALPLDEFPLSSFALISNPSADRPKSFALRGSEMEVNFTCGTNASKTAANSVFSRSVPPAPSTPSNARPAAAPATVFPTKLARRLARQSSSEPPAIPTTVFVSPAIRSRSTSPRRSATARSPRQGAGWVSPMFGNKAHSSRRFSGERSRSSSPRYERIEAEKPSPAVMFGDKAHSSKRFSGERSRSLSPRYERIEAEKPLPAVAATKDVRSSNWVAPMFGNKPHSSRRFSPERKYAQPNHSREHKPHQQHHNGSTPAIASRLPIDDVRSDTSSSDDEAPISNMEEEITPAIDISRVSSLSSSHSSNFVPSPEHKVLRTANTQAKRSNGRKISSDSIPQPRHWKEQPNAIAKKKSTAAPTKSASKMQTSRRAFVAAASLTGIGANGVLDIIANRFKTPQQNTKRQTSHSRSKSDTAAKLMSTNDRIHCSNTNYVAAWLSKHVSATTSSSPLRESPSSPSKVPTRFKTPDELKTKRSKDADRIDQLTDAAEWSRLLDWLKRMHLHKYAGAFRSAGITKLSIAELLREADLKSLNIADTDIPKIMYSIHEMSRQTKTFAELALTPTAKLQSQTRSFSQSSNFNDASASSQTPANKPEHSNTSTKIASQIAARTVQMRLMRHFDEGQRDVFLDCWSRLGQCIENHSQSRSTARSRKLFEMYYSLEFYCNVYFAVFPMHRASSLSSEDAVKYYRLYLDNLSERNPNPALEALFRSRVFAAYAGLAMVPDPRSNPAFASLFDPKWATALRSKLSTFLSVCATAHLLPERGAMDSTDLAVVPPRYTDDNVKTLHRSAASSTFPTTSYLPEYASSAPKRRVSALLGSGNVIVEEVAAKTTESDVRDTPTRPPEPFAPPPAPTIPAVFQTATCEQPHNAASPELPSEPAVPPPISTTHHRRRVSALLGSGPVIIENLDNFAIRDKEPLSLKIKSTHIADEEIAQRAENLSNGKSAALPVPAVDTHFENVPAPVSQCEDSHVDENDVNEETMVDDFATQESAALLEPAINTNVEDMPKPLSADNHDITLSHDETVVDNSAFTLPDRIPTLETANEEMSEVATDVPEIKPQILESAIVEEVRRVIDCLIESAELRILALVPVVSHDSAVVVESTPSSIDGDCTVDQNTAKETATGRSYLHYLKNRVRGLNTQVQVDDKRDGTESNSDEDNDIRVNNPFLMPLSAGEISPTDVSHEDQTKQLRSDNAHPSTERDSSVEDVPTTSPAPDGSESESEYSMVEEARDTFDVFGSSKSLTRCTPPLTKRFVRSKAMLKQLSPVSVENEELMQYNGWQLEGTQWKRKVPSGVEEKSIAEAFYSDENLSLVPAPVAEISERRMSMQQALQSLGNGRRHALTHRSASSRLISRGYSNATEDEDDDEAMEYATTKLKDLAPFTVRRASLTISQQQQQQHSDCGDFNHERDTNATPLSDTSVDSNEAVRAVMRIVDKRNFASSASMELVDSYQASPFAEEISSTGRQLYDVL